MTELVKIAPSRIGDQAEQTVDARDLHEFLGVGRKFASWIRGRIEEFDFTEGRDFVRLVPVTGTVSIGAEINYRLSMDMAKELSMVERNERGRQARRYFIEVEKKFREQNKSSGWLETRVQGKLVRRLTTDIIKEFIEYAKRQGSQSADKYYMNFSKLVNANLLEIEGKKPANLRDQLNVLQLHQVSVAEGIITKSIVECIGRGCFYKDVYQIAKERIQVYASTVGRSRIGASEKQLVGLLEAGA